MAKSSGETLAPKPPPRFRFSIGALLLTMLAFCVAAAGASYYLSAAKIAARYEARENAKAEAAKAEAERAKAAKANGTKADETPAIATTPPAEDDEPLTPPSVLMFIIPLAAPAIVVIFISTAYRFLAWMNRPRKR